VTSKKNSWSKRNFCIKKKLIVKLKFLYFFRIFICQERTLDVIPNNYNDGKLSDTIKNVFIKNDYHELILRMLQKKLTKNKNSHIL